jgi:spore maturation protein SpmB
MQGLFHFNFAAVLRCGPSYKSLSTYKASSFTVLVALANLESGTTTFPALCTYFGPCAISNEVRLG